jgi:hypothetical protein
VPALTLGWEAVKWAARWLRQPNGPNAGQRWDFVESQVRFLLWWYAIDADGEWLFRHGVRRLSKGSGKSPFAAVQALLEFCAPVRLEFFDPDLPGGCKGRPVDMPWVQIAATAESQTVNTMRMVRAFATKGSRVAVEYQLDVGKTVYYRPGGGQLQVVTSSTTAAEGAEATFVVADETEHWKPSNGGPELAATLNDNLAKSGSRMLETANSFEPGVGSVAEGSWEAWVAQEEGRTQGRSRILYDARVAPPDTDMADEASLMRALEFVYGDCWWQTRHLTAIRERIWDPRSAPNDSRRKYLNQIAASNDAWLSQPEWAARVDLDKVVTDDDAITLGFDGSRSRARGVTDATALIGCRVSDGHLFEIGVWEQPESAHAGAWQVPTVEVDAAVRSAFGAFNVVGFYADPAKWETYIASWEATFGPRLKVKSTRDHPIEWWMTGGRSTLTVRALEQFHSAVLDGEMTHDGAFALTRHALNAHRRPTTTGLQIAKEHPDSPRKIDAVVAAVLAWQARLDALSIDLEPARRSKTLHRF